MNSLHTFTTRKLDPNERAIAGHDDTDEGIAFFYGLFRYALPLSLALWAVIIGIVVLLWQVVR